MAFSLRRAVADDAPVLADIHMRARREAMPYLPDNHTPGEVLEFVRDVVLSNDEIWVAESAAEVAGFLALSDGIVHHLYVYSELQGQGAGSALLERAKELCPNGFTLWVFQRNAQARSFYEHRGLRLVELTDGAGNEEREPDALYEWRPG